MPAATGGRGEKKMMVARNRSVHFTSLTKSVLKRACWPAVTSVLLAVAMVVSFAAISLEAWAGNSTEPLGHLPVQDNGRVKPFESFARETLQLVYGSESFQGRPAVEIITTWMLVPEHWNQRKIVQIPHRGLKEALKLDPNEKYFSPNEVFASERLSLVMQELAGFRETKQKMDPYFQAAQRLESQLGMFQAIKAGQMPHVAPPKPGSEGVESEAAAAPMSMAQMGGKMAGKPASRWLNVSELDGELREKFATLTRSFIQALPKDEANAPAGEQDPAVPPLETAVQNFKAAARAQNPEAYPSDRKIDVEVHYKELHPFKIAWAIYLVAALIMAFAWHTGGTMLYRLGWVATIAAFLIHTYGFAIRVYLAGRPPVSNMYESVVWVSWGAVIFAMMFEVMYRRRFLLVAGCSVGVLCLVAADLAPSILDSSIQPLEPVLRSNLWLTVHVLTITISYSAFFLAWALSNLGLFFVFRGDKPTADRVRELSQSVYRALQVGVVLLAAGIILGGIWADYSWGRFWGWDPKETWALIALLGYLAMLHGRLVGLLQNFGMMVASVVAFNLVIMAWYGVNYVLGAGLHSYGFGAGGVQYVSAFVLLNLIYVGYVAWVHSSRRKVAPAQEQRAS
jgi:cytochrome c-type biogenesis protein CcsB